MLEFEDIKLKADDVGTRYSHYRELLTLWEDGLDMLVRQNDFAPHKMYLEKIALLEKATSVLRTQIEVMCGYKNFSLRYKVITDIPEKAENIKGGRGTPLRPEDKSHWHVKDDDDLLGV